MNREALDLLTEKEYVIIRSSRTKEVYVDKDRRCYIFSSVMDAESFCDALGDGTYFDKKMEELTQNKDMRHFYACGVRKVIVKLRDKDEPKEIPLSRKDVLNGYYNPNLKFHILRLKQTGTKAYLRMMEKDRFIVPVYLKDRSLKEYPYIYYVFAEARETGEFLLLFSSVEEFDEWKKAQKDDRKYCPLEITSEKLQRIRKDRDVVINPLSDMLFLGRDQLNDMHLKEGQEIE